MRWRAMAALDRPPAAGRQVWRCSLGRSPCRAPPGTVAAKPRRDHVECLREVAESPRKGH
eukprot:10177782-Alexandrium_andersonii.AAC.1